MLGRIIAINDNIVSVQLSVNIYDYDSLIIYIVQNGDTLWNIAKKFRSTIEDISRVNGIENKNLIMPGQKLYIPKFEKISEKSYE